MGLSEDLEASRRRHGEPPDWRELTFPAEVQAIAWARAMVAAGCLGGQGNRGWRHGYYYTITELTVE